MTVDDGLPDPDRDDGLVHVPGIVVAGHGVASGRSGDPRFPGGTLAMQRPFFAARGVDLSPFHPGTINVSIAPRRWGVVRSDHTLRGVRWHPSGPAEDFSFVRLVVVDARGRRHAAMAYRPHPDTKPDHHQPDDVVEVLAPRIPDLVVGDRVMLLVDPTRLAVTEP